MKALISQLHYPVDVLGPGRRIGIWFQGCTIRCFGCISRNTWPSDTRFEVDLRDVLGWVDSLSHKQVDGVTISGGEPFDQPVALMRLLDGLYAWRASQSREIDILAYSGRTYTELQADFSGVLSRIDAVVAEPFIDGEPTDLPLRGSANQRVVPLTPLAHERYSGAALDSLATQRRQVQLEVADGEMRMIGIPEQGLMRRIQAQAAAEGVTLGSRSWLK